MIFLKWAFAAAIVTASTAAVAYPFPFGLLRRPPARSSNKKRKRN